MASGRILSRRISRSEKVASLKSDTARMVYTWMIPYTDVEGRMEGDLDLIKADVVPKLKHIGKAQIWAILKDLYAANLITLYAVNGRKYIVMNDFENHQTNLRKDREAPSRIPPPPDLDDEENRLSEENLNVLYACDFETEDLQEFPVLQENPEPAREAKPAKTPEAKKEPRPRAVKDKLNPKLPKISADFEAFWLAYPKRIGKQGAWYEWEKIRRLDMLPPIDKILLAVEKQHLAKITLAACNEFVAQWPDPERWIKKMRWNDEIITPQMAKPAINNTAGNVKYLTCTNCGSEVLETSLIDGLCYKCLAK